VLDRRGRLGLGDEALAEARVLGERRRDDLQRHEPIEPELGCAVDDPHSAAPRETLDAVVDEHVAWRELRHMNVTSSGLTIPGA
jgi:hypothetical protein